MRGTKVDYAVDWFIVVGKSEYWTNHISQVSR